MRLNKNELYSISRSLAQKRNNEAQIPQLSETDKAIAHNAFLKYKEIPKIFRENLLARNMCGDFRLKDFQDAIIPEMKGISGSDVESEVMLAAASFKTVAEIIVHFKLA